MCLIKVLTGMTVSFLYEVLWATATDMPTVTSDGQLAAFALGACALQAVCCRVAAGMAAASACASTRA